MSTQRAGAINFPFQNFFENLQDFFYDATTYWGRFWNPQFFFGCNVQDLEVEHQVLNKVGSYGSQLSTILDTLDMLIAHMPMEMRESLTPHEWAIIDQFEKLVWESKEAVAEKRGARYPSITQSDANRLIDGLFWLARYNPGLGYRLRRQLENALGSLKPISEK